MRGEDTRQKWARASSERREIDAGILRFPVPRKRKKKTFSAATAVRELARERVGSPKPSQLVKARKDKPEKHKPTLGRMLNED